ncbi:MAG: WXG100 family type VII secretion target [Acidimicrobiia bacterium]
MNPEDLVRLGHTFNNQAEAVESLRGTIQSGIDGTVWESPAATEFRNVWESEFVPMLGNLREALGKAAQAVQNSHDKVVEANRTL